MPPSLVLEIFGMIGDILKVDVGKTRDWKKIQEMIKKP